MFLTRLSLFFYILWLVKPTTKDLFSWHPTMMAFAYLLFMLEGIYHMYGTSSHLKSYNSYKGYILGTTLIPYNIIPLVFKQYFYRIYIHATWQSLALICSSFGLGVIYLNKEHAGKKHFTTWHGFFGLMVVILTLFNLLIGISIRYIHTIFGNKLSFHEFKKQGKIIHALFGLAIVDLCCLTLFLLRYSNWAQHIENDESLLKQYVKVVFSIGPLLLLLIFNCHFVQYWFMPKIKMWRSTIKNTIKTSLSNTNLCVPKE